MQLQGTENSTNNGLNKHNKSPELGGPVPTQMLKDSGVFLLPVPEHVALILMVSKCLHCLQASSPHSRQKGKGRAKGKMCFVFGGEVERNDLPGTFAQNCVTWLLLVARESGNMSIFTWAHGCLNKTGILLVRWILGRQVGSAIHSSSLEGSITNWDRGWLQGGELNDRHGDRREIPPLPVCIPSCTFLIFKPYACMTFSKKYNFCKNTI